MPHELHELMDLLLFPNAAETLAQPKAHATNQSGESCQSTRVSHSKHLVRTANSAGCAALQKVAGLNSVAVQFQQTGPLAAVSSVLWPAEPALAGHILCASA
jgi:hypothetical protein